MCYAPVSSFMPDREMESPSIRTSRGPLALMAVGALVLLVIIGTATWLAQVTTELSADVLQARAARTAASDELETMLDAETGQRGYILTGDPSYLEPYTRARARLQHIGGQLCGHLRQPGRGAD